ncbi:30S ribosomal protein S10P, partial [mine drainage metagenome]
MVQKARISLTGTDSGKVDSICKQIREISQKTGVFISGPIPLPTKRLKV